MGKRNREVEDTVAPDRETRPIPRVEERPGRQELKVPLIEEQLTTRKTTRKAGELVLTREVKEQVQTVPIADQMAQAIWTYDGAPWPAMAVSGSCGPESCTVDVSGTPDGAAGEDLYTFDVRPADGTVKLLLADLHGYPTDLNATLDEIARAGVPHDRLAGLELLSARWVPPPDDGQYVLSYRSGGEEGSPALDVVIDLPGGTVLDVRRPG